VSRINKRGASHGTSDPGAAGAGDCIVLASASPRRAALLRMLDLRFRVAPHGLAEMLRPGEPPIETARRLAAEKAAAAQTMTELEPREVLLAADTIVVLDGRVFGKPASRAEARLTLESLSGREHQVISAVALYAPETDSMHVDHDCSAVRFRSMSPADVEWYLDTREWRDAAGGYKAQGRGAWFVEAVHGSFYSVMGLPIHCLYSILRLVSFRF